LYEQKEEKKSPQKILKEEEEVEYLKKNVNIRMLKSFR
jgi:hypothetical protein